MMGVSTPTFFKDSPLNQNEKTPGRKQNMEVLSVFRQFADYHCNLMLLFRRPDKAINSPLPILFVQTNHTLEQAGDR